MALRRNNRICASKINIGPQIGTGGATDQRICAAKLGVGPTIGMGDAVIMTEDEITMTTEDGFILIT
jgi:hypothetical protein